MLGVFTHVFVTIVLPVVLITLLGAVVHHRSPLHLPTLTTLNLYLFMPVFIFVRISESTLLWLEIGKIGLVVIAPMIILGLSIYALGRHRAIPGATLSAMLVAGLFFNAGNFGMPVSELAFGQRGSQIQALVMVFSNLATFLVGYIILAVGKGAGPRAAFGVFKLPYVYLIVLGLIVRDSGIELPSWLSYCLHVTSDAMIPLALVTLGAQLVEQARWPRWHYLIPTALLKLVLMPITAWAVVWTIGLWPWPGAAIVLASAAPTAVNVLLLTLEVKGDAETVADCVFWTTIGSAVSVTALLAVLRASGVALP